MAIIILWIITRRSLAVLFTAILNPQLLILSSFFRCCQNWITQEMPRLCKLPGAKRKTPKWVSSPSLSSMSKRNGETVKLCYTKWEMLPERPKKRGVLKGELPFNTEQVFDDVPLLHQQRFVRMTQDDGVAWNRGNCFWWWKFHFPWNGGNTFFVHKFIVSRICVAQAMLRHMVNWVHDHPAPPQALTKRALGYKKESWDKGVQYMYVYLGTVYKYKYTYVYLLLYLLIYLSSYLLFIYRFIYLFIYLSISPINLCFYVCIYPLSYLFIYLSIHLSIYSFIYVFIC